MSTHALTVLDGATRVGALEYESLEEPFSFACDPAWKTARTSYSISPHIPMLGEPAASGTVRRFLENLLPEAALDAAPAQAGAAVYRDDERPFVRRIAAFVQDQARRLLEQARPMREVDAALL